MKDHCCNVTLCGIEPKSKPVYSTKSYEICEIEINQQFAMTKKEELDILLNWQKKNMEKGSFD